jgi:endonuclease/exonuclease/phosphatase (EEP) superfamily protein YafD
MLEDGRTVARNDSLIKLVSTMTSSPQSSSRLPRRRLRRVVGVACWLYLVAALSLWLFLLAQADRWWPATLVLFGPRWVALLPLVILLPAALLLRRRSLWTLAGAAMLVLFPVMGLSVPWRQVISPRSEPIGPGIRVITCNAHRSLLDSTAFANLIASTRPDVVAIQEWTSKHQAAFANDPGWYVLRDGELCLVSRYPIRKVEDVGAANWKPHNIAGAAVCYELATPHGPVPFINLHLASPHRQFDGILGRSADAPADVEKNSDIRRAQAGAVNRAASRLGTATLIAGDFNTPAESDVFDACRGRLADAFDAAGLGLGYTYYSRWTAVRIDHVLCGPCWRPIRCWIGPEVGSPHRPLIAELEWVGPDGAVAAAQ